MINRKIVNSYNAEGHKGFMGSDHVARTVIQVDFKQSDPFIMLMDDFLDKKNDDLVGGAHPHGGFEIVSLLIDGKMGGIETGGMQVLTTGSGIVHTETIDEKAMLRLMQLWINLPKEKRNTPPKLQDIKLEKVPKIYKKGIHISVYAGEFEGLSSPVLTNVPLIIADVKLESNVSATVHIPANFTTFIYNLDGNVAVGIDGHNLKKYQVGWLDRFDNTETSELILESGDEESRLLIYSAQPLHEQIISHGPFIGDTSNDIAHLYKKYRQGQLPHISTFKDENFIKYE